MCVVLLVWKVCIALNSTPATCILAFLVRFKAFGLVDLLGIQHAAAEEFALGRLKGMNQMFGDVRCRVSCGLWMGLVYS